MAPRTYYAAKDRAPSARSISDAVPTPELVTLWVGSYRVYAVDELGKAARRAGIEIGATRRLDSCGRRISKGDPVEAVKATRLDTSSARHPDLVKWEFTAAAPNRLWATELTFALTWAGVAYICFVDAFRIGSSERRLLQNALTTQTEHATPNRVCN